MRKTGGVSVPVVSSFAGAENSVVLQELAKLSGDVTLTIRKSRSWSTFLAEDLYFSWILEELTSTALTLCL